MKTILVVYTHAKLTKKEYQTLKKYSFNTKSPVKVEDHLEVSSYDTPVQVVEVLQKPFKYVNIHTGNLSNKKENTTKQYEIREISIRDEVDEDVLEAVRVTD